MCGPDPDISPPPLGRREPAEPARGQEDPGAPAAADEPSLRDLFDQLDGDAEEGERAFQGLESLEPQTRRQILAGLDRSFRGSGTLRLLELLADSADPETRTAARAALRERASLEPRCEARSVIDRRAAREVLPRSALQRPSLVRCLVTTVDGAGRGSIGVSSSWNGQRRSALFACDLERGLVGALGTLEEDTGPAGRLLDDLSFPSDGRDVAESPELALRLLAGCRALNGPAAPESVHHWLESTLGGGFGPRPFPAPHSASQGDLVESAGLPPRARAVLEACPTWLDASDLTFELAEEIELREGQAGADPRRDAGAFRYLFEHRILARLELYRRMLVWMSLFWSTTGASHLAESAQVLAEQLGDEQYAVPGHPFAVALMTRSLDAAAERLGTGADPRRGRREP